MVLEDFEGNYNAALEALYSYYDFQTSIGEDIEEVRIQNLPIEEDLLEKIENAQDLTEEVNKFSNKSEEQTSLELGNYPNPFNPTTNIRFTLPERSQVSLVVFDMLGREVARLVNDVLPAGEQNVRFDASNLANGVYLYKFRAGSQEIIRKMTLIK